MKRMWVLVCLSLASIAAQAQDGLYAWETYEKRIKASSEVPAHGPDLFGDQISLSNGAVTFSVTDVSVPGNSALPVAFGRTFTVSNRKDTKNDGSLADWHLDVPHISGVFAPDWVGSVPGNPGKRCSVTSTLHASPPPPSGGDFSVEDFWNGNALHIPGREGGELLLIRAQTPRPGSGRPYYWHVAGHSVVSCLSTTKNQAGWEAFLVTTADGTRYWFDWAAAYYEPPLRFTVQTIHPITGDPMPSTGTHVRRRVALYATRVEDRFGNSVVYNYSNTATQPAKLDSIVASDGRRINITYASGRVSQVESVAGDVGSRVWRYEYDPAPDSQMSLARVILPGDTAQAPNRWTLELAQLSRAKIQQWSAAGEPSRNCFLNWGWQSLNGPNQFSGRMTHPSGAVGEFDFEIMTHGRSWVPVSCSLGMPPSAPGQMNDTSDDVNRWAISYQSFTLKKKTLSGPGVPSSAWTYEYQPNAGQAPYRPGQSAGNPVCPPMVDCSIPQCTDDSCAKSAVTTVRLPGDAWERYWHGNTYRYNEGKLLKVERGGYDANGNEKALNRTTNTYDLSGQDAAYPARYGTSARDPGNAFAVEFHRPLLKTVIEQQDINFSRAINRFNLYAQPLEVTRSSTLPGNPLRKEVFVYENNTAKWVIGQVGKTTCVLPAAAPPSGCGAAGTVMAEANYDSLARPTWFKSFGKLVQTLTYNPDGTVATVEDGNGNVTTLSSWKRGIPGVVHYPGTPEAPSGAKQSAVVNDHGWIAAVTDESGARHCYDHDAMGRISKIRYPSEAAANVCDPGTGAGAWLATRLEFSRSPTAAYGLPAGHWQHVVETGAGRKITYMDAMWRPVVTEEFDGTSTATANATRRLTVQRYDAYGRQVFSSYPMSSLGSYATSTLTGTYSSYDALGRVVEGRQDWEGSGVLTTKTEYQSGFQTRVTPPRGGTAHQTTTSYLAWDEPSTEYPVSIAHPAGAFTDIARNAFGKPLSLTRRNASSSVSLTRNYVYDAHQQLCKAVEPETSATIMAYDGAGNLQWSKAGATQAGTDSCDTSDIPAAQRTVRTYDARNRLQTLSFPDGRGNQTWTYTPDGLADSITTYNSPGGDLVVNSYNYNRRRLLVGEMFQVDGKLWNLDYGYSQLGQLASITSPGLVTDLAPNALGQPTRAGTYATAVNYFPNGGMKQFTYGNGIRHTLTQNARGLPETSCDFPGSSCSAGAVLNDSYDYDGHGNVLAISDGRTGNRGDRDMTYDALDRLTRTVSPMFGTAGYSYDVLDNLRTVQVTGGSKVRNHTYFYDGSNQLTNVTETAGGATVVGLEYDAQGNLKNKSGVLYHFDHGNRLREANGEQYLYDGHGRRVLAIRNGQKLYSLYGHDGVLRFQRNDRLGKTIDYVNLNGSLVAQVESVIPLATPALSAPSSSASGSYTVSWTSSPIASRYQLQERKDGGAWATIHDAAGTSRAVSGKTSGNWAYQVRACSATACGSWSSTATVAVMVPPATAPALTVPATGLNGSFTIGWGTVAAASRYQLQERQGSGGWSTIQDSTGTSRAISGKAAGNWSYQVRGCNDSGCGSWSAIGTVQVIHAPTGGSTLTVPATSYTGAYTASWTSVATATRYELEERLGSAGWAQVHNAAATSRAISGKAAGSWGYRVRACNAAGCAAWSAVASVAVTLPPGAPSAPTVPANNTSGSYSVTWTGVTHATRYQLQERLGTGGWATIHDAAATSKAVSGKTTGSWGYQVRACNVAGCSAWSAVRTVAVVRAPAAAPTLSAPASSTTHNYTVSWTAVVDAVRYELEEQSNGSGVWNKIQDSAATSRAVSGKQTGSYAYRVRGCNTSGCAAWSTVRTVVVTLPIPLPVGAPSVHDSGWSCDASWPTSGGATYYELRRNMTAIVYSGPNASTAWPGQACVSPHDVRACNANGCSAWSPPGYHTGGGGGGVIQGQPSGEGSDET